MKLTEPDLLAVRELPPACAEPSDEAKSRTWYLLTQRRQRAEAPRTLRRVLLPVGAAAVVVAVAAGVMTVVGGGGGAEVAAPKIDLIKATHQDVPSDGSTTPEAVAALNELADVAELSADTPLPEGSLIYVDSHGWAVSIESDNTGTMRYRPRTDWFDPQGMIWLKGMAGNDDLGDGPYADREGNMARARQFLVDSGPGIRMPTPQWLASLPTDPEQLLAVLRESVGEHTTWSVDEQLWDEMGGLYSRCELTLSPRLRAALLRAFTGMDGLTVGEVDIDGWKLVSIRHTEHNAIHEILFDPVNGRAVGRRSLVGEGFTIVNDSGPRFEPNNVLSHSIWVQAFVDEVGERP